MDGRRLFLGVTPPITLHESSERERELTASLLDELRRRGAMESEEDRRTREIVLDRLATLVKSFVRAVSLARGLSAAAAESAGGKIFPFGSYRLGVYGPGADIDVLCVVPKHVSRDDFFDAFEGMLKDTDGVTEVVGVPDAHVPIIKLKISGIPIDFLMARLELSSIPDDQRLWDDNLLRNLDERCIRSLGGSRVTDEILRLVPNVSVFRDALRCIKLWASRRAIYSKVIGFFGGVAWAMLVARICQLYPNAVAGAIVGKFFTTMDQWPWPKPVLLRHIEVRPLGLSVWNPRAHRSDRAHRMPIITPAYPAVCATHHVTASTQKVITKELKRGADFVKKLIGGTAEWSELFEKHDFFYKYKYYLQVIASTGEHNLQIEWAGFVESRLRHLVMKLEDVDLLALVHPFVEGFHQVSYCASDDETRLAARGETTSVIAERRAEDIEGIKGARAVFSTIFYIGLGLEAKQPGSTAHRKLDISSPCTEFGELVKSWSKFDEQKMRIFVRHTKSSGLPDDVFDPGERRPVIKKRPKQEVKPSTEKKNVPPDPHVTKNSRSQKVTRTQPVIEVAENGVSSAPRAPKTVVVAAAASDPTSSVDASAGVKDPAEVVKSSQLALGEEIEQPSDSSMPLSQGLHDLHLGH